MTENRYKTILGGTGLAYLKNDQPVDVETRNVRSEKTKGVDDPIEQATKLMEMCRCQYLDDANDLWTCHKPPEDTSNFFSSLPRAPMVAARLRERNVHGMDQAHEIPWYVS